MAKWLREYFNIGLHKDRSPPEPPKPDYSRGSPEPGRRYQESALMRAYRLQKERDFEDPYNNGPGSSLRRLRAMCQESPGGGGGEERRRRGDRDTGSAAQKVPAGHAASPLLLRSQSERRAAGPSPTLSKSLPPKHRLIKLDSVPPGEDNSLVTWSPGSHTARRAQENNTRTEQVAIRDDYADPFDVQNMLKNKTTEKEAIENNGYMEPYEAQKMMAEIHRQESQKKGIQLYDTPYEPEVNGVGSDTENIANHPLRESRLPQDDDRPAEEYDQPWEWNKVTMPNFAAQFNGIEKKQLSSPLCDRRRQLRPPALFKHGSPEFCGILGERVDPTAPLEKQVWYHGAISRIDAENLLRLCKECSYLVRNSQSSKNDYSLSLKSSQGFMHMKLTKAKDKYILGQNSPPFDSVPEVIHFYTTRKLPIKGAEHLSLLYPVIVRTL